jgi:hypothetical protein
VEAEITAITNQSTGRKVQILHENVKVWINPAQITEILEYSGSPEIKLSFPPRSLRTPSRTSAPFRVGLRRCTGSLQQGRSLGLQCIYHRAHLVRRQTVTPLKASERHAHRSARLSRTSRAGEIESILRVGYNGRQRVSSDDVREVLAGIRDCLGQRIMGALSCCVPTRKTELIEPTKTSAGIMASNLTGLRFFLNRATSLKSSTICKKSD